MITDNINSNSLYYRLIAMWVICEAFAGGIMHGARIPFTGMAISSLAVSCIIFIAWFIPGRMMIIRATILVAVFKLMLSPHSPPTAYIAVFFQGITGEILLRNKKYFTARAILFAMLALTESAIQRVLVLIILYGNDFWSAVNVFLKKITGISTRTNFSLLIAGSYIMIHGITGIFVGYYAAKAAGKIKKYNHPEFIFNVIPEIDSQDLKRKKRLILKPVFFICWLFLLFIFIQSYLFPEKRILNTNETGMILIRSVLILLTWYFLLAPLAMLIIKKKLNKQKDKRSKDINAIMLILPDVKMIFIESWKRSSAVSGMKRLKLFIKIVLINIVADHSITA